MCRNCGVKLKDYHETSTKYLLGRYNYFIAFNTTSSRWGATSVLSTLFSFLIALSIGLLAISLALSEGFSKMIVSAWVALGFTIFIGLIGTLGMLFMVWVTAYWLRFPLKEDSPTLTNINKTVNELIPQELRNIDTSIQEIGKKMERQNEQETRDTKTKRDGKA